LSTVPAPPLPSVAPRFERDMACTEADWLRWLPPAVGSHRLAIHGATARVEIGAGQLHLHWAALPPRRMALVSLPRLQVGFVFENVDDAARAAFMRRFDLYLHRGGG
jgi:hypothetical protein